MKEKVLYAVWGALYILCVGLGFVEDAEGFGRILLIATALIFFIPGVLLTYEGHHTQNKKMLLRVRIVSGVSLLLTAAALAANVLSANASSQVGDRLYEILALVSAPMLCAQYWVLSIFLWACLLMGTLVKPAKQ